MARKRLPPVLGNWPRYYLCAVDELDAQIITERIPLGIDPLGRLSRLECAVPAGSYLIQVEAQVQPRAN